MRDNLSLLKHNSFDVCLTFWKSNKLGDSHLCHPLATPAPISLASTASLNFFLLKFGAK